MFKLINDTASSTPVFLVNRLNSLNHDFILRIYKARFSNYSSFVKFFRDFLPVLKYSMSPCPFSQKISPNVFMLSLYWFVSELLNDLARVDPEPADEHQLEQFDVYVITVALLAYGGIFSSEAIKVVEGKEAKHVVNEEGAASHAEVGVVHAAEQFLPLHFFLFVPEEEVDVANEDKEPHDTAGVGGDLPIHSESVHLLNSCELQKPVNYQNGAPKDGKSPKREDFFDPKHHFVFCFHFIKINYKGQYKWIC